MQRLGCKISRHLGVVLAALDTGCASYGSHLTASPLPPGGRQLSLNADALVVDRGLGPQPLPNPELGYRWGARRELDLGGRLNAGSAEFNARWRVARGAAQLALVPGVGAGFVPVTNRDTGLFNLHALTSILTSFGSVGRSEVTCGARAVFTYALPLSVFRGDASEATVVYQIGGTIGVRAPLGARSFVFPELNLLVPYDSQRHEWYFPTLQGGVAFQFE